MNTNKLMDMYNSTFQPALEEGVYNVKMLSHEYVAKDEKTAYIKFQFKVIETGRVLTENRFEKGFGVLVSHLRQQLNRENEAIQPKEFFDELIKNETPFKIWVVKKVVNGAPRTNFNFLEPIKEVKPNTTVVEDAQETVENTQETIENTQKPVEDVQKA